MNTVRNIGESRENVGLRMQEDEDNIFKLIDGKFHSICKQYVRFYKL